MKRLIPLVYDFDFKVMLTLLHGIVVLNHSAQAMAVKWFPTDVQTLTQCRPRGTSSGYARQGICYRT